MRKKQKYVLQPLPKTNQILPEPQVLNPQSNFQSNIEQIKSIVCRYYTLFRIAVLLPLSVISRIASVYFLVNIALSSTESFDAWWKLLSLIGYVFYFTVGSILFFMIAPSLEIEVGRKEKSHGYFGGIIGELKGVVFRGRYQLPQTYEKIISEERRLNPAKKMNPDDKVGDRTSEIINAGQPQKFTENSYLIKLLEESSIIKDNRNRKQKLRIYDLQRKLAKFQQKQRQRQQVQQEKQLLQMQTKINHTKSSEQLSNIQSQKMESFLQQIRENDRRRRLQRQHQQKNQKIRKEDQSKEQNAKLQLLRLLNQIKQFQTHINSLDKSYQFEQKIVEMLKKYLEVGSYHKIKEKYGRQQVIKELLDRQFKFLVEEIQFRLIHSDLNNKSREEYFFSKILLQELLQIRLLGRQINGFPQSQKQLLLSHMILKKELKQLNAIQVKEKKFYLFLFNLLNATDAMIAWYDYYQLPDVEKFQKFESSYYFLILCFEQIPQIIAQGFSLNYVEDNNKAYLSIFVISLLKLAVCTILKLYNAFIAQNTETRTQKQHRQHLQRIKKYQQYHAFYIKKPELITTFPQKVLFCIFLPFLFVLVIAANLLPITNRILLYIYLRKVMKQDPLVFWVSMICLGYYFIVGNSLAILAYNVSREDRKKYRDKIFTCTPEHLIKWVISLIIVIFNALNLLTVPLIFIGILSYLKKKDITFFITFNKFYYKSVYIYLAFEGIPFTIIYSMALARSQNFGDIYRYEILVLVLTLINILCSVGFVFFVKYMANDAKDEVLEVVM